MDATTPDRTLKSLRLTPQTLVEIVDLMSQGGRRAVVKLDDHKIDDPRAVTAAELSGAKEIDVTSYWTDPARPTWGRRHFVYFIFGPAGTQYFGDSTSREVTDVCGELDAYFSARVPAGSTWARPGTTPSRAAASDVPPPALVAGIALGIAIAGFMLGRWSVSIPESSPAVMETSPSTETIPEMPPVETAPEVPPALP